MSGTGVYQDAVVAAHTAGVMSAEFLQRQETKCVQAVRYSNHNDGATTWANRQSRGFSHRISSSQTTTHLAQQVARQVHTPAQQRSGGWISGGNGN